MASDLFVAAWDRTGGPAWTARHGLSHAAYQSTFEQMTGQGFRPRCVSGYTHSGGEAFYTAIWDKGGGGAWAARHGLSPADYQATFNQLVPQGFRPTCVSGYSTFGQERYAAIFEQGPGPAWVARHGLTSAAYQQAYDRLVPQGYRPRWVSLHAAGGQERYTGVWEQRGGPAWVARHGLDEAGFHAVSNDLEPKGFVLVCAGACAVGGRDRYVGVWEQTNVVQTSQHGLTPAALQAGYDQLVPQGYRPRFVAGYSGEEPVEHTLRFQMQQQTQSQWCWAATSVSVDRFYNPASTWTQCAMANAQKNQTNCCGTGASGATCNSPDVLQQPLARVGRFASMQSNSVTYATVRDQVLRGRPLCIRVRWGAGPAAHFVAATGCDEGRFVLVSDCGSGTTSLVAYDTLRTAYNGSVVWTHSYFTQP